VGPGLDDDHEADVDFGSALPFAFRPGLWPVQQATGD